MDYVKSAMFVYIYVFMYMFESYVFYQLCLFISHHSPPQVTWFCL